MELSKSLGGAKLRPMGLAEDAFERIRRIAFEGEHVERMAALGVRMKLSPGVIKTLVRLAKADGVSMGDMARGIGCDPSYITALVDDLDERGLARREPSPDDRRVKIIVLTDPGRSLAAEIDAVVSVPPAAFGALVVVRAPPAARPAGQGAGGDGRCAAVRGPRRPGEGGRDVAVAGAGPIASAHGAGGHGAEPGHPMFGPPRRRAERVAVPAVSVEHLSKSYGDTVAVRDVSFEVHKGEVFALLGPNGAGKTTTVEILEGFRDRSGGRVETLGVDPADRGTQRWLRTRIGVVLQELAVEPYYSVRQVLARNAGYYPNPRPVDEVIDLIGLGEKADDRVKRLSGGQQRRLDVGLGIIGNPELLFLDEPTTGLDPSGRRETWDLIRLLAAGGTTVLLTTHYMDEVEALADRVAVLFGQEVVASGTPSSIGGRDLGAVTIRFRLPEGVAPESLPVPAQAADDGHVEIHTEDEVRVLHELTGWALAGGHRLQGLSVLRVSLEDIYLGLTQGMASRRAEQREPGAGPWAEQVLP